MQAALWAAHSDRAPSSDFGGTLKFATAGAVFNLQSGYTANSTDAAIADNLNINPIAPPLEGDFNGDDIIDAADYVVWRNGLGMTYTQTDYNVWRANFLQSVGNGAALTLRPAVVGRRAGAVVVGVVLPGDDHGRNPTHRLIRTERSWLFGLETKYELETEMGSTMRIRGVNTDSATTPTTSPHTSTSPHTYETTEPGTASPTTPSPSGPSSP